MENNMDYRIIERYGHFEVYVNEEFFCSADTMIEAVHEVENNRC